MSAPLYYLAVPRTERLGVSYDRLPIIDVHTHTSGSGSDGPVDAVVRCMDQCGVEQAFMFAPMLQPHGLQLTDGNLDDIRRHNDYIAWFCAQSPERLLAFCVLNPNPMLRRGDIDAAVASMVEEARRCYHELGIRGVKLVPDNWSVRDPRVAPLFAELAELGMYAAFHSGIFLDERSSEFCRPASYEGLHLIPGFHGHVAHLSWPWVDECIAMLAMETFHALHTPKDHWQLKVDLAFGCPPDWQLESLRKAFDMLPHDMLMYASDVFWPCDDVRYTEQFIYPQFANVEAAATISRGTPDVATEARMLFRRGIFYDNARTHWEVATRGVAQKLQHSTVVPSTPNARQRHEHAQRMRAPGAGPNQPVQQMS